MSNKTTEALKLAEEACKTGIETCKIIAVYAAKTGNDDLAMQFLGDSKFDRALAAIREALADQEERMVGVEKYEPVKQEPVADNFVGVVTKESLDGVVKWKGWIPREGTKLYAAPVDAKAIREAARAEALEASRQALEALVVAEGFVDRHSEDWYISGQQDLKQIREAITNMREALAEPVNREWMVHYKNNDCKAQDANSPDCICWTKAEPVKQEPVAFISAGGFEELKLKGKTEVFAERDYECVGTFPLYAAPVDAKAIRAEALEEAAKVCDDESRYSNYADCCAAAIRNLK